MQKLLIFAIAMPLVAACSSLRVDVSILRPQVAEREVDRLLMRKSLPIVLAETETSLKGTIYSFSNEHYQAYIKAINSLAASSNPADQQNAKDLNEFWRKSVRPVYDAEQAAIWGLDCEIQSICPHSTCIDKDNDKVALLLRSRERRLSQLQIFERADISALVNALVVSGTPKATAQQLLVRPAEGTAALNSIRAIPDSHNLIGSATITDLGEAYAVVNANLNDTIVTGTTIAKEWKKPFDSSHAWGTLGDLNLAIKMEERGNFTIKGVTFDPSDVARVASKITSQSIIALAQIGGVPIHTQAGATDSSALGKSSDALATAETSVEQTLAAERDRNDALLSIAAAIVRENDNLKDNAKRPASMDAIKATFDANKPRIGPAGGVVNVSQPQAQ